MTDTMLEAKFPDDPNPPKEKDEVKEDKDTKGEFKIEGKDELKENKDEIKEQQDAKFKAEKADKDEKEFIAETRFPQQTPDDVKWMLLQHAEQLEAAAATLRHFIAQSERPDLKRGALRNEPDDGEDG